MYKIDFMESEDYVRLKADAFTSSKELYAVYCLWCDENLISPLKSRTFSDETMKCMEKYHLEHTNEFKKGSVQTVENEIESKLAA